MDYIQQIIIKGRIQHKVEELINHILNTCRVCHFSWKQEKIKRYVICKEIGYMEKYLPNQHYSRESNRQLSKAWDEKETIIMSSTLLGLKAKNMFLCLLIWLDNNYVGKHCPI